MTRRCNEEKTAVNTGINNIKFTSSCQLIITINRMLTVIILNNRFQTPFTLWNGYICVIYIYLYRDYKAWQVLTFKYSYSATYLNFASLNILKFWFTHIFLRLINKQFNSGTLYPAEFLFSTIKLTCSMWRFSKINIDLKSRCLIQNNLTSPAPNFISRRKALFFKINKHFKTIWVRTSPL